MLDFSYNNRRSRLWNRHGDGFRIGVGGYTAFRISSHTKFVFKEDGNKEKDKDRNNFFINNFRYGLKTGANFKIIHRNAGNFANAWGFGLDVGAKHQIGKWKFGLMVKDVTGTFTTWFHNSELVVDIYTQTGNTIPENSIEVTLPTAILGVATDFNIKEKINIQAEVDFFISFDGKRNVLVKSDFASIDPSIGLEASYKKLLFLRFGLGDYQEVKDFDLSTAISVQPNFGIGVRIKNFQIDYALTDIGDVSESLYSHVFSLKIRFISD